MANAKYFVVLQLICVYALFSECKLEEFYRWKQMSFEGLPLGKVTDFYNRLLIAIFVKRHNRKAF